MSAIEVKDLSKSFKIYKDKGSSLKDWLLFKKRRKNIIHSVLKNISFEVKKGEIWGLIGENGCGKSTLLKLLSRIMYPSSGTINTEGKISSLIELGAGFHPDMSGRENIYTNASIFGLSNSEIDKRIQSIIDFSELSDYIDSPVRTYSSGMYMRLAFSVAVHVDADILLIDEILAVGDANFQKKCFEHLQMLKTQGITIIIVTHDMGTVKNFCTKAIWIESGKIREIGNSNFVVDKYLGYMEEIRFANSISRNPEQKNYVDLLDVVILDNNNKNRKLSNDNPWSVGVYFINGDDVEDSVLSVAIYTAQMIRLSYCSKEIKFPKKNKGTSQEISLRFSSLPINSGDYFIKAFFTDKIGNKISLEKDVWIEFINEELNCLGLLAINGFWIE